MLARKTAWGPSISSDDLILTTASDLADYLQVRFHTTGSSME